MLEYVYQITALFFVVLSGERGEYFLDVGEVALLETQNSTEKTFAVIGSPPNVKQIGLAPNATGI